MVDCVVRLQARGLRLRLDGDRLMVSPPERLTIPTDAAAHYDPAALAHMQEDRAVLVAYIREHKPEIVAALASADMWEERRRAYGEAYRAACGDDQRREAA